MPGYGHVRASKLATNWDSSNVSEEYTELIERNMKLVDLRYGFVIEPGESDAYEMQFTKENTISNGNIAEFERVCRKYDLNKELERLSIWKTLISKDTLVDIINKLVN